MAQERSATDWARRLQAMSTSTLADVLDGMGVTSALSIQLRRVSGAKRTFAGQAYCVRWSTVRKGHDIMRPQPSTWEQVAGFLVPELDRATGRVYVAGAGPLICDAALAGGLSATYFAALGFDGLVLGGAIRDPATLATLDLPVVATNFVPSDTQGAYRVAQTGSWCVIEHVVVNTGDWVVSDEAGTIVIPRSRVGEVLERAEAFERTEARMLELVRSGARLPDLVAQAKRI